MGYVHDIYLDKECDPVAFASAVHDVRTLISRIEIPVVGPSGRPYSKPILKDDRIEFNGVNYRCVCPPEVDEDEELDRRIFCRYRECITDTAKNDDSGQAFMIRLNPGQSSFGSRFTHILPSGKHGHWFDCKTHYRPYDLLVMVSLLALKHHLGDEISVMSKSTWGGWLYGSSGFWSTKPTKGAVEVYEHIFPDRAPVANILDEEGW